MITPPLSPYGSFEGTLFQYHRNLVAFESFSCNDIPTKKLILVGGLSDGLIPTPYTSNLQTICDEHNWSLVQPILSSSYLGFGNGSLTRDTEEIAKLISYLQGHRGATQFAMVGHSTGCQNFVHFLKHCSDESILDKIKLVVLQAPVSDREGPMTESNYELNLSTATKMVEAGDGEEMMPRHSFWAPITASRFLALQSVGGDDDFFSSDFTDEELQERLGHISKLHKSRNLKLLLAYSGKDEYVPDHVDKKLLVERMCNAMNFYCDPLDATQHLAVPLYLEGGNHNLSETTADKLRFVDEIGRIMSSII